MTPWLSASSKSGAGCGSIRSISLKDPSSREMDELFCFFLQCWQ